MTNNGGFRFENFRINQAVVGITQYKIKGYLLVDGSDAAAAKEQKTEREGPDGYFLSSTSNAMCWSLSPCVFSVFVCTPPIPIPIPMPTPIPITTPTELS